MCCSYQLGFFAPPGNEGAAGSRQVITPARCHPSGAGGGREAWIDTLTLCCLDACQCGAFGDAVLVAPILTDGSEINVICLNMVWVQCVCPPLDVAESFIGLFFFTIDVREGRFLQVAGLRVPSNFLFHCSAR